MKGEAPVTQDRIGIGLLMLRVICSRDLLITSVMYLAWWILLKYSETVDFFEA